MSKAKAKKWDKADFLAAWVKNQKATEWSKFHGAMSAASGSAGCGKIEETVLALRCGAIKRHLGKAGYAAPARPERPSQAKKQPGLGDIAKKMGLKKL